MSTSLNNVTAMPTVIECSTTYPTMQAPSITYLVACQNCSPWFGHVAYYCAPLASKLPSDFESRSIAEQWQLTYGGHSYDTRYNALRYRPYSEDATVIGSIRL